MATIATLAWAGPDPSWSAPIVRASSGGETLDGISCPAASQCTAVDAIGQEVTFDPASPGTPTPVPIDNNANWNALSAGVACPTLSQCTAVDYGGYEVTFNPQSPGNPVPVAIDNTNDNYGLYGLACPAATQCTAVDYNGGEVTFNPQSPGSPPVVTIAPASNFAALACPTTSQCTAGDASAQELTFDPTSPAAPTPHRLSLGAVAAVACPSVAQCTVLDQGGGEVTFDPRAPGTPSRTTIDSKPGLFEVACPASSQCTAVDALGAAVTFDPQSPGTPAATMIDPGRNLHAVACVSALQCTSVDNLGAEVTFNPQSPGTPIPITIDQGAAPKAVSVAPSISSPGVATVTKAETADLSANVNPNGLATAGHFEYGLDARYRANAAVSYDQSTPEQAVGTDSSLHTITATVSGLLPNAIYHVRAVASNSAGSTTTADQTFVTKESPAPPPPVLGRTFDAKPVSGIVFVKLPPGRSLRAITRRQANSALAKGRGFVPLTEARQLPAGTEIDARRGTLRVAAASPHRGRTQAGLFGGALFKLTQKRSGLKKGLTTLALLEGGFAGAPSFASCKAHHGGASSRDAHTARLSSKVLQTLRARVHGRFRTRGRYGSASVRGTVWDTSDRCNGTLTAVHRGTVLVTDFVRHITVIVRAGQSYLARAITGIHP